MILGTFTTGEPLVVGNLYTWGNGAHGRTGQNTVNANSSPIQVGSATWRRMGGGPMANITANGISSNGNLFSWGYGNSGMIGDGQAISRSSPVQIGAITNWLESTVGSYNGVALRDDGRLYLWGSNNYGVGNWTKGQTKSSPVQIASENWASVGMGRDSVIAVTTGGQLWTWGNNSAGILGQNIRSSELAGRSSPVQVGTRTDWLRGLMGEGGAIAVRTDGYLFTWGSNTQGQIGNNTGATYRSSPIQVGYSGWAKIASGSYTRLAIKENGTLWAWGYNGAGECGISSRIDKSSPVQIGALTTWTEVAACNFNCFALRSDGTMWSWGDNQLGQLGIGTEPADASSPVQIGAGTSWANVASINEAVMAIKSTA